MVENKYDIKQLLSKNKHIIYFNATYRCGADNRKFLTKKHKQNIIHKAKVRYSNNQCINDTHNIDLKRMFYKAITFPPHSGTTLVCVYYQQYIDSRVLTIFGAYYPIRICVVIRINGKLCNIIYEESLEHINYFKFKLTKTIQDTCYNLSAFLQVNLNYSFVPTIEKDAWNNIYMLSFPICNQSDCRNFIQTIPKKNKIKIIMNAYFEHIENLSSLRPENFKYLKGINIEITSLSSDLNKQIDIVMYHFAKFKIKTITLFIGHYSASYLTRKFNSNDLNKFRTKLEIRSSISSDINDLLVKY